jgi:hypothetical protein
MNVEAISTAVFKLRPFSADFFASSALVSAPCAGGYPAFVLFFFLIYNNFGCWRPYYKPHFIVMRFA